MISKEMFLSWLEMMTSIFTVIGNLSKIFDLDKIQEEVQVQQLLSVLKFCGSSQISFLRER
jgi:hypothetical protein